MKLTVTAKRLQHMKDAKNLHFSSHGAETNKGESIAGIAIWDPLYWCDRGHSFEANSCGADDGGQNQGWMIVS
jgi:hypothetical protein